MLTMEHELKTGIVKGTGGVSERALSQVEKYSNMPQVTTHWVHAIAFQKIPSAKVSVLSRQAGKGEPSCILSETTCV